MNADLQKARAAIATIPMLANSSAQPERLGGLTNLVFRIGEYCLRLPGQGTEEYINREDEKCAAQQAARVGVSPDILYVDTKSGIMVTRFVGDGVTMTPALFKSRKGAVQRAGRALANLHNSDAIFPSQFDLFKVIDLYLAVVTTNNVALPKGFQNVMSRANAVRATLARNPAKPVASHCDPLCENFIDTGSRVWIIDWEYAGMNDPMWDLGDLSVEAGFSDRQDMALLTTYFNANPNAADYGRMVAYKTMSDLLWALWGLIQLANNNPAEDFRTYADGRFIRCRNLMETPEFEQHMLAIQAGAKP